ncbi:hypothetical protein L1047_04860 [Synechococcus sp. Nb3U1]|uniref:hypothetical protein n=1 Tax=Synechococcus sp. Nb3U1 TaxID=1914529 RepID=UPI001F2C6F49|nr:hypothetical protein [Synechococcus sp. Nb3U1]MCF2970525.1 hypothetical protein [Synechococcus sp. Nb3U1]
MNSKAEYLQELEQQIAEATQALEILKSEYREAREAAQHKEIERLEQHLESAKIRSQDLVKATDEVWQDLKALLDEVLHSMRESLKKLIKH